MQRDRHVTPLPHASCSVTSPVGARLRATATFGSCAGVLRRGLHCRSAARSATATSRSCRWRLACGLVFLSQATKRFRGAAAARPVGLACPRPPGPPRTPRSAALSSLRCSASNHPWIVRPPGHPWPGLRGGAAVPRQTPAQPARTRVHPWTRPPAGARTRSTLRCSAALRGPIERTRHPWLVVCSRQSHDFGRSAHPAEEAEQSAPSCNQPWMAGSSTGAP